MWPVSLCVGLAWLAMRLSHECVEFAALQGNTEVIRHLLSWDGGSGYLSTAGDNRGRKPIEVARNEHTRQLLTVRSPWVVCHLTQTMHSPLTPAWGYTHIHRTNGVSATVETQKESSGFLDEQEQQLLQLQCKRSSRSKQSRCCELRFTWRYDASTFC